MRELIATILAIILFLMSVQLLDIEKVMIKFTETYKELHECKGAESN